MNRHARRRAARLDRGAERGVREDRRVHVRPLPDVVVAAAPHEAVDRGRPALARRAREHERLVDEDPAELAGVDVAVVGAPTDDLVSDRPGTRFGPRAILVSSDPDAGVLPKADLAARPLADLLA